MDESTSTAILKKRVVGRAVTYHENEMLLGNYLQVARESILDSKLKAQVKKQDDEEEEQIMMDETNSTYGFT